MLDFSYRFSVRLSQFFFFISDFIPFSPNGSQSHPYFFNYPPMLLRSTAYRIRPWRPQLGSSDPESDTPSPSCILSYTIVQKFVVT